MPPNATGLKRRPESIRKSAENRRGWKHSEETRKYLGDIQRGRSRNKGIVRTPEQRAKISATLKAKKIGFQSGYTPWNKGKRPEELGRIGRWQREEDLTT